MKTLAQFTRKGILAATLGLMPLAVAAQDVKQITFVSPSPSAINSFPVHVAVGEGYFADEGLAVTTQAINGSSAILQALAAGQADFGRPGPAPVIVANSRGVEVTFLYNSLPRSSFGILVQDGSPIQSPEDLRGATIGVGTADGAEVGFARAILSDYGMSEPADYTFIPVGDGGPATAGLQRGDIVAYVGSLADRAIITFRGMPMRDITPEKFDTLFGNGYAAMTAYVNENPEIVEGFGRALVRATIFTRDPANRDRVLNHLEAANPQEIEDRGFANALLDAVLAKGLPHNPELGWGYNDPEHWQAWHDSLVTGGDLAAPMPDVSVAYSNAFVEAWNTLP